MKRTELLRSTTGWRSSVVFPGVLILLSSLTRSARAEHAGDRTAFAQSLIDERDYFRAITVFKELAFSAPPGPAQNLFRYEIIRAYRRSRHYELAVDGAAQLLQAPTLDAPMRGALYLQLGASYLGLKLPSQAVPWFDRAWSEPGSRDLSDFYLAYTSLASSPSRENGRRSAARFSDIAARSGAGSLRPFSERFVRAIARAELLPSRNPWLAGSLSAIVPGLGQVYTGHYVDALQAVAFVGAFAFTSFVAYRYEHERDDPYILTGLSLSITALFHIGNVVGAVRTASYFNQYERNRVFGELNEAAGAIDF